MRFITGCLYWSTSSAKACRSPRWTRSMSLAPGSRLAAMGVHVNKNRKSHKVALLVNRAINIEHPTSNIQRRTSNTARYDRLIGSWMLDVRCWMFVFNWFRLRRREDKAPCLGETSGLSQVKAGGAGPAQPEPTGARTLVRSGCERNKFRAPGLICSDWMLGCWGHALAFAVGSS